MAPRPLGVRVNVTHKGTLVRLTERGAVVQLSMAQPLGRQTTVAIEASDRTVHLPARVTGSIARRNGTADAAHHVSVEFLTLTDAAALALRRVIGSHPLDAPTERSL